MEKQVTVNGIKLSITDDGSGKAIVFIHGLGGYKENWEENVPYFSRTYRTIAVDLPGFGESEKRTDIPYGVEFFSDTVCALLKQLGVDKAHWVGNSMGGHVAAFTAIKHPAEVDKLVLVDAAGTNSEQIKTLLAANQTMFSNPAFKPPPELINMMIRTMIFFGPCKQADKIVEKAIKDADRPDAAGLQDASLKTLQSIINTPINDRLGQIKAPTLVYWGRNDNLLNVAQAGVFSEKIAGAKSHITESCGHCPMIEKPDEFNRTVAEFLA